MNKLNLIIVSFSIIFSTQSLFATTVRECESAGKICQGAVYERGQKEAMCNECIDRIY